MDIKNTRDTLHVLNSDCSEARFTNAKLVSSCFEDVNLQGSRIENANLAEARFVDVNLTNVLITNAKLVSSRFEDVNLQGSRFENANLADARFVDVNLTNALIKDATLDGMTIDGIAVSDLLRAYTRRARAVLYAKNLAPVQAFYQGVLGLEVEGVPSDHVVLTSCAVQLVIVQIPAPIAATIEIAVPPVRRSETPIKLVFDVTSIAAVRDTARRLGGDIAPATSEWIFSGQRVCDGQDPEGNVIQLHEIGTPGAATPCAATPRAATPRASAV